MALSRLGSQSSEDRLSDLSVRGDSWPRELSCERVQVDRVIAGRRLLVDPVCLVKRKRSDDDDGAQIASRVQMSEAVRAVDNLATAQAQKDAPSLIDVNHWSSPKEFSGKEEDFQQWARKTEAFFAEVIKESEPTDSNEDRGVRNLELILQHMHEMLMTRTSQRSKRHCCQLTEEPTGGVATTT